MHGLKKNHSEVKSIRANVPICFHAFLEKNELMGTSAQNGLIIQH